MNSSDYTKKEIRRPAGYVYPELVKRLARAKAHFDLLQEDLLEDGIAEALGFSYQAFNHHVQKAKREIQQLSAPQKTLPTKKK